MSLILGLLDSVLGGAVSGLTGAKSSEEKGGAIGDLVKQLVNPVTSIVQGIMGASAAAKAKKAFVPLESFRQQSFLNELEGKRKALQTGSLYKAQQDAITQQGALSSQNVLKSTSGDIGATIGALNRINRSTGRNLNELYGNMSMEALQLDSLIGNTVQQMANREYQINMGNKMQKLAQAEQMKKDAGANILGTLHQAASGMGGANLAQGFGSNPPIGSPNVRNNGFAQNPLFGTSDVSLNPYQNIGINPSLTQGPLIPYQQNPSILTRPI